MWEHNARINHLCTGGVADPPDPTPLLFSASDDRSVRAWDMMTHACVTVLRPPNKHCGTMRALCTTEEHLYIGASDGVIYVYCINGESRLSHMKHRRRMQAEIAANEAAKLAASGKRQYKAPEDKKERVFEFTLECQLDHTRGASSRMETACRSSAWRSAGPAAKRTTSSRRAKTARSACFRARGRLEIPDRPASTTTNSRSRR